MSVAPRDSYPEAEAVRQFALGDIVEIREGSPFAYEFKGIQLKIVSLRIDPDGKQWASTIDFKPGYLPRHRGNGFYDSETTDIDAEHFSLIRPVAHAQPPTKPWVCCNCDADLSCGACGVEHPNDSAYYEGIVKENERLKDRLADAKRIIAEYKAGTIAGAKADVAAHGLPGAQRSGNCGASQKDEMLAFFLAFFEGWEPGTKLTLHNMESLERARATVAALSLPSTVLPPPDASADIDRCPICDWPMAKSQEKGCIPGDCSYRPSDPAEQERLRRRRAELSSTVSNTPEGK